MQQWLRVHGSRMNTVDELKRRLVDVWHSLQQNVIDAAINEWRSDWERALLQMDNIFKTSIVSLLRDRINYGQIKRNLLCYLQKMLFYHPVCDF